MPCWVLWLLCYWVEWSCSIGKVFVVMFHFMNMNWIWSQTCWHGDIEYASVVARACCCQPAKLQNWTDSVEIWDMSKVVWTKKKKSKSTWTFVRHISIIHETWRNVCRCCCGICDLWNCCCWPALRSGAATKDDGGMDGWWRCWLCRDSFVLKILSSAVVWSMSAGFPPRLSLFVSLKGFISV